MELTAEQKETQNNLKTELLIKIAEKENLITEDEKAILNGNYWSKKESEKIAIEQEQERINEIKSALRKSATKFVKSLKKHNKEAIIKPDFVAFSYIQMEKQREYYNNEIDGYTNIPSHFDEEITYFEIPKPIQVDDLIIPSGKLNFSKRKCDLTRKDAFIFNDEQRRLRKQEFLYTYAELGIEVK